MESAIDDAIGAAIRLARSYRYVLMTALLLVAAYNSASLVAWVDHNVNEPLARVRRDGLSAVSLARGLALGVTSGVAAPGVTVPVLFALARLVGAGADASAMTLALLVNVLLSPVDLALWAAVYAPLGSRVVAGGRYVRPFLSGSIPWALSAPVLYATAYAGGLQAHAWFQ